MQTAAAPRCLTRFLRSARIKSDAQHVALHLRGDASSVHISHAHTVSPKSRIVRLVLRLLVFQLTVLPSRKK